MQFEEPEQLLAERAAYLVNNSSSESALRVTGPHPRNASGSVGSTNFWPTSDPPDATDPTARTHSTTPLEAPESGS